jgi:hypothetical protein
MEGRTVGAGWTVVYDDAAYERALRLARGSYQRDLLEGLEALSGSTLRGKAKEWGAAYARSRQGLLDRLRRAGVPVSEEHGKSGRRLLVIGVCAERVEA